MGRSVLQAETATTAPDSLADLLSASGAEITGRHQERASSGTAVPVPQRLHPGLRAALAEAGITSLHLHQQQAIAANFRQEHVLLTTGTASGKSLAYQVPTLARQLADEKSTALFLYPTKALAHDQARSLSRLAAAAGLEPETVSSYDGDTPSNQRPLIRSRARSLISNPDMLNSGILPHHTLWREFLRDLQLVVIDEIHTYRGVFGSHVAGVIRRLLRLTRHYGNPGPRFLLTSATLGNPRDHARALTGQDVTLISEDTSPRAGRDWFVLQPPLVHEELGIRRSALQEAVLVTARLLEAGKQVLLFCGSRQAAEEAVMNLRPLTGDAVRSYRSGLLPQERRLIERELQDGTVRAVAATSALELGVDIGSVDAVVMAGYPGTAAAFRQQAGRAGRRDEPGLAVLTLGGSPLDQYLATHPEYLFGIPSEQVLCDPDHLLIALDHLRCAAFELPVSAAETFGGFSSEEVQLLLGQLGKDGEIHQAAGKSWWIGQSYPAAELSLRNTGGGQVTLRTEELTVGTVDALSARWLTHPGAVYVHDGQPYEVQELDLEANAATLVPTDGSILTRAVRELKVEAAEDPLRKRPLKGALLLDGDVMVTETVTGYRRLLRQTLETVGRYPLALEPYTMLTGACVLSPAADVVDTLRASGSWGSDPNDYGPGWQRARRLVLARDGNRCQVCGTRAETGVPLHVHHKVPFRAFASADEANRPANLSTLCPSCHRRAEQGVRIRSGLAAVAHALRPLAPLLVMCDVRDLGVHSDPASSLTGGRPALIMYETVPGGIGLAAQLAGRMPELLQAALDLIVSCPCEGGCPACVGPAGEPGHAGKDEAVALLRLLT